MEPRWTLLGGLVRSERLRLGYRQQRDFAARVGISRRVMSDLERGARTTYKPETLAAVEAALGWEPGAVAAVLAGGQPVRERDDDLALLHAAWPRLTTTARRALRVAAQELARDGG